MGFFDRLRRKGQLVYSRGGLVPGGYRYINGTLATNETIYSAVSMLSGAIAALPVAVREDYRRMEADEHPTAWLLRYGPNPYMTTFEFMRALETLRDTTGAGYALKELDKAGNPAALWLLRTENVEPMIDADTRELYYQIRDGMGHDLGYVHNSHVLAVSHLSEDGINPVNPIAVLRSSLEYDREVKEFSVNQMQNGLRARVVMQFSGSLSAEQLRQYDENFRRFQKAGVVYLDNGKKLTELKGSDIIDPKVFEVENITIARVARVYTIPLDKFLPDKTSYSSAEQSDLNYLRDTVLPMVRMYEQEFSRKLLSEQDRARGRQIRFTLNGFARADMQTRGEFYQKAVRNGWLCLDEIRGLEDLPPIPGGYGREFYISKDLIPVRLLPGALQKEIGKGEENG